MTQFQMIYLILVVCAASVFGLTLAYQSWKQTR